MSAILYNPDHTENAGDETIGPEMRAECDRVGGYVIDTDTGDVIYGQKP